MTMNWPEFYRNLTSTARIPAVSSSEVRGGHLIIRDLHVNLAEALEKFRALPKPTLLTICADVVTLPKDFRPVFAGEAVVIAARRIEYAEGSWIQIDMRKTPRASFKIFALEISAPSGYYEPKVIDPEGQPKTMLPIITPKGVSAVCFDQENSRGQVVPTVTIKTGAGMEAMLSEDSTMALSLASIFDVATLLFDKPEHTKLAASQLTWVGACAAQSPLQDNLASASAGLLAMTQTRTPGAAFVPELDRNVYAATARAFVPLVAEYERQYERFEDQSTSVEERIAAAKLMLAKSDDAVALSRSLVEQAQKNLRGAATALETAQENVKKQQAAVEKMGGQFQVSVEWWIEKEKFNLSLKIITAVIKTGASIGRLAVGDATAVPSALDQMLRDLEDIAVQDDPEAAKAAELAKTLSTLKATLKTLMKLFELTQKLVTLGTKLDSAITTSRELLAPDVIDTGSLANGPEQWDIFTLRMDDALQPAIDKDIKDTVEYRQALRILAVHGKALTAARAMVVQLGQELVRLQLVGYTHEKEKDRLTRYVADLEKTREVKAGLRQMFFRRYLDAKRSLFVALEQYRAAYAYWALAPSSVKPSLTDRVSVFENGLNDLAKIALDTQTAFDSFRPQTIEKSITLKDPTLLATLKSTKEATWTIPLAEPELVGYDRVRITKLRIWLLGAKPASATELFIVVSNSGNYLDRRRNGRQPPVPFQFVAKPLDKAFAYKTVESAGQPVRVEGTDLWVQMECDVHDEVKYAYFAPTVFSQWSIRLPETKNRNLDLSQLTGIRMDIVGSAIAATGLQGGHSAAEN